MNDQIRELAGRALDKSVPYTWTKLDYNQIQELLSCYAELIVRECMKVADDRYQTMFPSEVIAKHFGVDNETN